jgi:hypothetical protein
MAKPAVRSALPDESALVRSLARDRQYQQEHGSRVRGGQLSVKTFLVLSDVDP